MWPFKRETANELRTVLAGKKARLEKLEAYIALANGLPGTWVGQALRLAEEIAALECRIEQMSPEKARLALQACIEKGK